MSEHEHQLSETESEAVLYRERLEDCYKSVRRAIEHNNCSLLYECLRFPDFSVPSREEARTSAQDWIHARERDTRALGSAKAALVKIEALAKQLGSNDNAELRQKILAETRRGLHVHI